MKTALLLLLTAALAMPDEPSFDAAQIDYWIAQKDMAEHSAALLDARDRSAKALAKLRALCPALAQHPTTKRLMCPAEPTQETEEKEEAK